jgi:PEGA domain
MKQRFVSTLAIAVAFSGLTGLSAAAQDRTSNGNTTGSAVPRGGGDSGSSGGSAVPRGDSGSSSSGSSGDSSGGSAPGSTVGGSSATPSSWSTFEAPRRSNEQSQGRTRSGSSGSSTGGRAVSRDGGSAPRGGGSTASGSSGDRSSAATAGDSAPSRRAVPEYSRPRDGRPVTGTAVSRGSVPPPSGGGGNIIYYPYYPWGFWGPGYGYGLGYLFYDPWYGGGYGYGSPYGYGGYGYGGYGGGGGGYAISQGYKDTGNLRLKIDPKLAQVYVDGYYVGLVDSFDGTFQKLALEGGGHKIELKAEGYEPIDFEVLITPGETVTYKGEMKKIR